MLPPNDQPSAPKNAKLPIRLNQSARPERITAASAASAPGIIAPVSCPKFPRIPQPIESDSATATKNRSSARGIIVAATVRMTKLISEQNYRRDEIYSKLYARIGSEAKWHWTQESPVSICTVG